jgi:type II secretory pathway pseudopilin PulG
MRRHAWTLIEVVVSVSIILLVTAIATPVFSYARENARISSAVSYMHQIGKAVSMYRYDWDTGGFGSAYEAGLPPYDVYHESWLGLTPRPPSSPCGYRPSIGWDNSRHAADYIWRLHAATEGHSYELNELKTFGENTLIVLDPWCNPSGTDWNNVNIEKRAIGLLLGGRVMNLRKAGKPDFSPWWTSPQR